MTTLNRSSNLRTQRNTAAAVTLWLLAAAAIMMLLLQVVEQNLFPPIGFIQAVIVAVPLIMVWRRVRGGFITTAVIVALLVLASAGPIVSDLMTPSRVPSFVWTIVILPIMLGLLVSSIMAAVRLHRARLAARSVVDR